MWFDKNAKLTLGKLISIARFRYTAIAPSLLSFYDVFPIATNPRGLPALGMYGIIVAGGNFSPFR